MERTWLDDLRHAIDDHRAVIHVTTLYFLAAAGLSRLAGAEQLLRVPLADAFILCAAVQAFVLIVAFDAARLTYRAGPGEPLLSRAWADLRARYLHRSAALSLAALLLLLELFCGTFTSLKSAMPRAVPFRWDATIMRVSLLLHGGRLPWEWAQPVLGHPLVTVALDRAYVFWFDVMFAMILWQALERPSPARTRFFVTFLLAWIFLGNGLAATFASAGPCYYGKVTGQPDPYAPLMEYLREVDRTYPLHAISAQEYLWDQYRAGGADLRSGISAMPSMHVAMAVLFALRGWRADRRLGVLLWAFALVIFAGSFHLGWHYAADGYLSAALTFLLWNRVGRWCGDVDPPAVSDDAPTAAAPERASRTAAGLAREPRSTSPAYGPHLRTGCRAIRGLLPGHLLRHGAGWPTPRAGPPG